MNLSQDKPPVYERCRTQFGVKWEDGIVLTYGDTIHSQRLNLSGDIIAHEKTHVEQQANVGRDLWWEKYFEDADFRLSQEVEAYKAQLKYAKEHYSRTERRKIEKFCYKILMTKYGFDFTEEQVKALLT